MDKPRLIYYQDAHHFHAKRLDPPVSIRKLQYPVDELLGTGVDVLAFGLGYGDVYFHDSKVGRVVGQMQETWKSFIDWRIMRMVSDAREMGTDQLHEVIKRGSSQGLKVWPSLKLQSCDRPGSDRCGLLKWERWEEVCIGEKDEHHPRYEFCYDYAHPDVRQAKLDIVEEVLRDYESDGIELDFMFVPKFFKTGKEEEGVPVMNEFVGRIRELADKIGQSQGRHISVCVRVFDQREYNLKQGLDVESWLAQKNVDVLVGQVSEQFFDTGLDVKWLAQAASSTGVASYVRPARRVYDERTSFPSPEMYRALAQNMRREGVDGMYLGYLSWPFGETEYQILREAAFPAAHERRDKYYLLQPREPGLVFEELLDYQGDWPKYPPRHEDEITQPPPRQLPVGLEEGKATAIKILISDDVDAARNDDEMRKPVLTIRFSTYCVDDAIEVKFNGEILATESAESTDEMGLSIPTRLRSPVDVPMGMSAHWFRYRLDTTILKRGENTLEIKPHKLSTRAGFTRSVSGVEIQIRYKDFVRPEGLVVERITPS